MNRQSAITVIQNLYPPNSQYPETSRIGKELLKKACGTTPGAGIERNWECLDSATLITLAHLCEDYDLISQSAINQELCA